jgi:hypothetical protein
MSPRIARWTTEINGALVANRHHDPVITYRDVRTDARIGLAVLCGIAALLCWWLAR